MIQSPMVLGRLLKEELTCLLWHVSNAEEWEKSGHDALTIPPATTLPTFSRGRKNNSLPRDPAARDAIGSAICGARCRNLRYGESGARALGLCETRTIKKSAV